MVKKFSVLLSVLLLTVCLFSGCGDGDNSKIIGKWSPSTAYINGETIQYSELEVDQKQFELNFEGNGSCTVTLAGVTSEGKYTFNDTSVDIKTDDEDLKLDYNEGKITLSLNYDNDPTSFTFVKSEKEE